MEHPSPDDMLMDHEYDGIREYDNPLPGWWTWLFVASVFFSVLYYFYYHIGTGPTIQQKYDMQVAAHVERLLEQLGEIRADNATILAFKDNHEWMSATKGLFAGNCSQCHGADGGGGIGPNLTDDLYINIKQPEDLFTVITKGVANKGMQAWEARLSEPQRILLAAYVASLRGTTPATPKAAEGSSVPAWSTFASEPSADAASDDVSPEAR